MNMLSAVAPWDMVAGGYKDTTMLLFRGYIDAALNLVPLKNDDQIADIACGPGTLSLVAANHVATVKALDFSESMLEMLRKGMVEQSVENIDPIQGDGQNLPFDDNVFDAGFSIFGLMFFPDRSKGFAELFRTLKPGGQICVSSWAPVNQSPIMDTMFCGMQTIKPDLPDPQYDLASLENPEVLEVELNHAGFKDIVVHHVTRSFEITSAKMFWNDMVKGSAPIQMLKSNMQEEIWHERSKLAIEQIENCMGRLPASLSATAYLGVGTK